MYILVPTKNFSTKLQNMEKLQNAAILLQMAAILAKITDLQKLRENIDRAKITVVIDDVMSDKICFHFQNTNFQPELRKQYLTQLIDAAIDSYQNDYSRLKQML